MLGLTRGNAETAPTWLPRTEVVRWDPLSELDRIASEMETLFGGRFEPVPQPLDETATLTPPVDLYETAAEVGLNVYLPGISREDIYLEVLGETIHIRGERKPIAPEKGAMVHLAEGGYGKFDLRYELPVEVKPAEVQALYRSGVLEVRLPKAESAKPTPVEIRVEG